MYQNLDGMYEDYCLDRFKEINGYDYFGECEDDEDKDEDGEDD